MFSKLLVANRGEIAVRILRTCREMGIHTVAVYEPTDLGAVHMRQADECVMLPSPNGLLDVKALMEVALQKGVQAVHPGYGFLAENYEFARACEAECLSFIGPGAGILEKLSCRLDMLERVRSLGLRTTAFAPQAFELDPAAALPFEQVCPLAQALGYPLYIKSCSGRPWRPERLVFTQDELRSELERLQSEARSVYTDPHFYLEKAVLPACQISVGVASDQYGAKVVLGDMQSVLIDNTRRSILESPAICLTADQRSEAWRIALLMVNELGLTGCSSVDFIVNGDGNLYFSEIKPYLPFEHLLFEMLLRVDLVREQLRIAAGEGLSFWQSDVQTRGCAMLGCLRSVIPPAASSNSDSLTKINLPGGPHIRVDTHLYSGMRISSQYDTLLAKLAVEAGDRGACVKGMQRAMKEVSIKGAATNLGQLASILASPAFIQGTYNTECIGCPEEHDAQAEQRQRDLAVAAAILYLKRGQPLHPAFPEQMVNAWRREGRLQPQWVYSGLSYEQTGR